MSTATEVKPGEIYRLIPLVMRDVGAIGKNRKNQSQNYAFRGIDDVFNALQPALVKHGVFVVPQVVDRNVTERTNAKGTVLFYTTLRVRFTLFASDGSNISAETVGEAMDSGDKSANKAMSAAMKYAMLEIFCIPTEENVDADYETHEVRNADVDPRTGDDPLASNDALQTAVDGAFMDRGISASAASAAIPKILAAYKVGRMADLTLEQRHQMVDGIRAGRADRFAHNGEAVKA